MNRTTFSSILFDFDGTLTSIDGMEFLAELQNLTNELNTITRTFRNTFSVTSDLYQKRMELLRPQRSHLEKLVDAYRQHLVPGAVQVCEMLHGLGKEIYILSGGIRNAIEPIGKSLRISPDHIFGVEVYFDPEGRFIGYDSNSPLTDIIGKKEIILNLTPSSPVAFIGDGTNDVAAREVVDKFIGYGGATYRPPIEEASDTYISDPDLTSVLPEILTTAELRQVQEHDIQHQAKAHFKIEEE
ncbi:MAG: HAD-IB family phosphatase [Calditrichota bacterium]